MPFNFAREIGFASDAAKPEDHPVPAPVTSRRKTKMILERGNACHGAHMLPARADHVDVAGAGLDDHWLALGCWAVTGEKSELVRAT
jgi:hypothetical protein